MNRRIKIVWELSIITMLLIFGGQAYWLYNQYVYSRQECLQQLKKDCPAVLSAEQTMREAMRSMKIDKEKGKSKGRVNNDFYFEEKEVFFLSRSANNKVNTREVFYLTFERKNKKKRIRLDNCHVEDANLFAELYILSAEIPLRPKVVDSLLQQRGYNSIYNAHFVRSQRIYHSPTFRPVGHSLTHYRVVYSNNPANFEAFMFDIDIPVKAIIRSMAWQLMGSLVLMIILAFCLLYQMRTILIQKRIDRLRQEFMKNMIYEMKQPPSEERIAEKATKIGNTDFFYSLNELRIGNERVIITSRQAEILKLLTDTPNEVVSRTDILNQIWGDDSYANSMALNVQITYLRRALKSDESVSIEAVMKKGYVLKEQQL
jgi:hypothetical protein